MELAVQARLAKNGDAIRNGVRAKHPSLLAGLVYDEHGERLTPTHTVKDGKRYRYYVTQAALLADPLVTGEKRGIPAHDLEELVCGRIQMLLEDPATITDAFQAEGVESPVQRSLLAAAKRWSDAWTKAKLVDVRKFLLMAISRITTKDAAIDILLTRQGLIDALSGSNPSRAELVRREENEIRLTVAARIGRSGSELRLVLPAPDAPPRDPDLPLLKAVARARNWYEKLVSGEVDSPRTIAKRSGLGPRYVARIFQCAFLAPDIVEAILEGRQPPELTLERLRHPLPVSWDEQPMLLGFSAAKAA